MTAILFMSVFTAGTLRAESPRIADTPEYKILCDVMGNLIGDDGQIRAMLLHDAVEFLDKVTHLDIRIDRRGLADAAIPEDITVELVLRGTLSDILASMLEPHDLTWIWRHGVIYVTTTDVAEEYLITRVYPVADLLVRGDGESTKRDFQPLIMLIEATVAQNTWQSWGGEGTLCGLETAGALVGSQTWQVHQQVESLLDQLRKTRDLQKSGE